MSAGPIVDAAEGFFKGIVKPLLDKWIPDAKDRLEAENLARVQMQAINMAQIAVNMEEAKSASLFVAGWRPAVGWICAASLFYAVIGFSFLNWILAMTQYHTGVVIQPLPKPDTDITMEILVGMLGIGAMRSYDKKQGTSK